MRCRSLEEGDPPKHIEATISRGRITGGRPLSSSGRLNKRSDSGARVDEPLAEHRRLLFSIAYRMLGSATEAEAFPFAGWCSSQQYDDTTPRNVRRRADLTFRFGISSSW
jgi:hypothetical protein